MVAVGGAGQGTVWWQWVGLDRVQSVTVGGTGQGNGQGTVWWQWVGLDRVQSGDSGWDGQGTVWWQWVGLDRGQVVPIDGLHWFRSNG